MYFSLDVHYTIDGKQTHIMSSRGGESLEQTIEQIRAEILAEHPEAQDITIEEQPKNGGKPYMVDTLIACIQKDRPDLSTEHLRANEWMILDTDRNGYQQGGFCMTLPEAKAFLANSRSQYNDFVYLRRYGLVLFDVGKHTSHEIFTAQWNWIETVLLKDSSKDMDDADLDLNYVKETQEQFMHNMCGFFMSRAMNMRTVHKSANMKLTAAEKMVFGHIDFRNHEPS